MDKDDKKLIIEYLIAHKNSLWTGLIVLGSGLAGILLTFNYSLSVFSTESMVKIVLLILGAFFIPLMLTGLINTNSDIKKILK